MTKQENLHYTHKLLSLLIKNTTPSLATMHLPEHDFKHVVHLCQKYGFIEQGKLEPLENGNGPDGWFLSGAVLTSKGKEFLQQSTAYYKAHNRKP